VSNLDAFSDGLRVLTTILVEHLRASLRRAFRRRRAPAVSTPAVPAHGLIHAQTFLVRWLYLFLQSVEHDPPCPHPGHGRRLSSRCIDRWRMIT
jgi:hypothetical protein